MVLMTTTEQFVEHAAPWNHKEGMKSENPQMMADRIPVPVTESRIATYLQKKLQKKLYSAYGR